MPEAIKRGEFGELHLIADADYDDGAVVFKAGRAGVVEGPVVTGDPMNVRTRHAYDVTMASATVVAAGVAIYFDNATKAAVVAAAGGDFYLGLSDKPKAAGELVIRVSLNEPVPPAAA
jgi:hypothetical protein